jgi:uncharacterized lipoprotein
MKNLVKFTLVALTFSVLGLSACAKKQEATQDASATAPAVDTTATAPATTTPADTTKPAGQ